MITIRDAAVEDAPRVTTLGHAAFVRQYEGLVDPVNYVWAVAQWYSEDALRELITRCAADPRAHFLIAEDGDGIAGFLQYDEAGPEPELHRLYVDAERRGQGAGARLIEALHERLPAGATYVLVVVEGNDRAVRFYERQGLREQERVPGHAYYRDTAGVVFPAHARDFRMILMRYGAQT